MKDSAVHAVQPFMPWWQLESILISILLRKYSAKAIMQTTILQMYETSYIRNSIGNTNPWAGMLNLKTHEFT